MVSTGDSPRSSAFRQTRQAPAAIKNHPGRPAPWRDGPLFLLRWATGFSSALTGAACGGAAVAREHGSSITQRESLKTALTVGRKSYPMGAEDDPKKQSLPGSPWEAPRSVRTVFPQAQLRRPPKPGE